MINNGIVRKSIIVVAMLSFSMALPAHVIGQENDSTQTSFMKGKTALQFQINSNFTLSAFTGTSISFQKVLSYKHAIRWGLSVYGQYQKDHVANGNNQYAKITRIGLVMNYLWYAKTVDQIRFYYGLGPYIYTDYRHSKMVLGDQTAGLRNLSIRLEQHLAIQGVAGVEWFAAKNTSLSAEYVPSIEGYYTLNISKQSSHGYFEDINQRSSNHSTLLSLKPSYIRFGISIYF